MSTEHDLPNIIIIAGPASSGKSWFAKSLIDYRWTVIEGSDWGRGHLWNVPQALLVDNCNHRTMSKIIREFNTPQISEGLSSIVRPLMIIVQIDFWPHPLFADPEKGVKVVFSNDFSTVMKFTLEYPKENVCPKGYPIDYPKITRDRSPIDHTWRGGSRY